MKARFQTAKAVSFSKFGLYDRKGKFFNADFSYFKQWKNPADIYWFPTNAQEKSYKEKQNSMQPQKQLRQSPIDKIAFIQTEGS